MMRFRPPASWRGLFLSMSIAAAALAVACGSSDPDPTATATPTEPAANQPTATDEPEEATATPSSEGFPLTITDAEGREHTFDEPITKVGCFWAGCSEMMADFGIAPYAQIGEQEQTAFRYPVGVPEVAIAENSAEEWAKAEVEVIFSRGPQDDRWTAIEPVAPVFFLHHPAYFESDQQGIGAYRENIRLFGQLLGMPEKAAEVLDRWDSVVAGLQEIAPEGASDLQVAALFANSDGTYRVLGEDTPLCNALVTIGIGQCVDGVAETEVVSAEFFLGLDPDWIIYGTSDPEEVGWEDRDDPVWGQLTAVQEGRVFDTSNRHYCCSFRGLEHVLVDYAHHVFDDSTPPAGPLDDFNPWNSPLLAIRED